MSDRVKILGYGVDTYSFDEAIDYIEKNKGQIVTINPEMIQSARSNAQFSELISNAEMVVPDGIGIEVGLKILGHKVKRIAGIDLGKALIVKFSKENKSIAMIGAKEQVIEDAVKNLKSEIADLNIVYYHNGYFTENDEVINELVNSKPDLVLVALGSPKQEFFIQEIKAKLPEAVLIGLGGSFDVWSGAVKRAPKIYQKLGIEWLYRTLKEPSRFKRIFPTLPLFILQVLKERLYK